MRLVNKHGIAVLLLVILLLSAMLAFMVVRAASRSIFNEQVGKEGVDYIVKEGELWATVTQPEFEDEFSSNPFL